MVRSVYWATREYAEMGKAKAEQTELHRDERGRTHQIWSLVWRQVEVWCGQTHTQVFSLRGVWTSNAKKGATSISTRHGCGGSRHKGMITDHGRSARSDLGDGHQEARGRAVTNRWGWNLAAPTGKDLPHLFHSHPRHLWQCLRKHFNTAQGRAATMSHGPSCPKDWRHREAPLTCRFWPNQALYSITGYGQ